MRGLAFAILVGLVGCVSAPQHEGLTAREKKLQAIEELARIATTVETRYEAEWHAAEVCAQLADEDTEHLSDAKHKEYAILGLAHAEKAIKLAPEHVEGHYYKCINLGRQLGLGIDQSAIRVADLMNEGELTARIDERFEYAGAHRFLGYFYFETPEMGPWGFGNKTKAEQHFQRALEIAPDYPENPIGYCKFLLDMENKDGARTWAKNSLDATEKFPGLSAEQRERLRQEIGTLRKEIGD